MEKSPFSWKKELLVPIILILITTGMGIVVAPSPEYQKKMQFCFNYPPKQAIIGCYMLSILIIYFQSISIVYIYILYNFQVYHPKNVKLLQVISYDCTNKYLFFQFYYQSLSKIF